jgi:SAM-dependent methyltransferase
LVAAAPPGCIRALDVGCGEGLLARELRRVAPQVVGIDADQASITVARQRDREGAIDFVVGDFLTYPFRVESFDLIASNRLYLVTREHWESAAPTVWPPDHTYSEIRSIAAKLLPGHRLRRHLLWRYSLIWAKPHGYAQTGAGTAAPAFRCDRGFGGAASPRC